MQCTKASYPSWQKARSVARRQMDKARRTTGKRVHQIEPYACTYCSHIHLTGHNETHLKKVG